MVGVGSDTIGFLLDQFSHDYNKAHPKAATLLYSWDAVDPATGKAGGPIVTKAAAPGIARPDGSSAGITALEANTTDPSGPGDFCIDYAGSSRAAQAGDPACVRRSASASSRWLATRSPGPPAIRRAAAPTPRRA